MIRGSGKRLFILINKADLSVPQQMTELERNILTEDPDVLLFISAKENYGLDKVRSELAMLS